MTRTLLFALSLTALACAGVPTKTSPSGPEPQAPADADTLGPGVHDVELGTDDEGEARTARVIWPQGKVRGALWVFHGGKNGSIDEMAPKWRNHRDRGWVLVFPQGQRSDKTKGGWHHEGSATSRHVPPLFRLHDRLTASGVDHHVATGFSSGASMVWWLACKHGDRFDAFVPFNNFLFAELVGQCKGPTPPMLLVAALDDERIPYGGRPDPATGKTHNLGARGSLDAWSKRMGCTDKVSRSQEGRGTRMRYDGCDLEHMRFESGGHTWPRSGADLVIEFAEKHVK